MTGSPVQCAGILAKRGRPAASGEGFHGTSTVCRDARGAASFRHGRAGHARRGIQWLDRDDCDPAAPQRSPARRLTFRARIHPASARTMAPDNSGRLLMRAGGSLATGLVRDNATQLAGYQATLGELITETSTPGSTAGMAPRPADAPLPGNAQAFGALMVIWEAVPRLEAAIRLAIAGHPGRRRGGSPANFLEALQSIVALSGGLDEDGEAAAARILERLV